MKIKVAHYPQMKRRRAMCKTCPFRGGDDYLKPEVAVMPAEQWPCHTEQVFNNETDIQCRGHFEAVRKLKQMADIPDNK